MGQGLRDILALFLIASIISTEAIKRELQREATETAAAPTSTGHSKAYAGTTVAPPKKQGGRKPNFSNSSAVKRLISRPR